MFLENIIGTSSKVKILRTLSDINTGFSIKELENETGLSRGILHREVTRLKNEGVLLEIKSKGKLKAYRLNLDNQYSQLISKLVDLEKVRNRQNKVILRTWNILESIVDFIVNKKINVVSIMLFGSQARGAATVTSDIDLLFIMKDKNKKDEDLIYGVCSHYSKKMDVKINLVIMSLNQFTDESKRKTKFFDEINKGKIEIYGHSMDIGSELPYDLEEILDFISNNKNVTFKDISEKFAITKNTAKNRINKLQDMGLINLNKKNKLVIFRNG